jgi:hypothetical protein
MSKAPPQKIAEKPAAEPTGTSAVTSAAADRDYDEITYFPGEGDPVRTTWNGLTFAAHVPTKVSKKHTVLVPMPQTTQMPDGTMQTRHIEKRIAMAELARNNPHFMVNGERAAMPDKHKVRVPESPDEYRGYAMRWIAGSTDASSMDVRWTAEQALRDRCGVNDSDIAYLRPFFEAKVSMMDPSIKMVG